MQSISRLTRGDRIRLSKVWLQTLVPVFACVRLHERLKKRMIRQIRKISIREPENLSELTYTELKAMLERKRHIDQLWRVTLFASLVRLRLPQLRSMRDRAVDILKSFAQEIIQRRYALVIPRFFGIVARLKRVFASFRLRRDLFLLLADAQWTRLEVDMIKQEEMAAFERYLFDRERRKPAEKISHGLKMRQMRDGLYPSSKAALKAVNTLYEKKCTPSELRMRILKMIGTAYRRKLMEIDGTYRRKLAKYELKHADWVFFRDIFGANLSEPKLPTRKISCNRVPDGVVLRAIEMARLIASGEDPHKAVGELKLLLSFRNLESWRLL